MDTLRYEELYSLRNEHTALIAYMTFSPDGTMLATCGLDGKLCIWGWRTGQLLFTFLSQGHVAALCCIWKLERNDRVICGLGDGAIAEYSFGNVQGRATVDGFGAHQYPVEKLALSKRYLASGAQRELSVWKQTTDRWIIESRLPQPSTDNSDIIVVTSLNWFAAECSEEELIATYMYQGIVFYKSSDWSISRVIKHQMPLCDAAISCDNKRLAVSRPGDGCEVYEINSGFTSAIRVFKSASSDSQKYPLPVRFAHNGRAVLMGGYEDVVTLWDVSSGLLHQSIPVQTCSRTTCLDAFVKLTEGSGSEDQFAIAVGYVHPSNTAGITLYTIKTPGPLKRLPTPRVALISSIASNIFSLVLLIFLCVVVALLILVSIDPHLFVSTLPPYLSQYFDVLDLRVLRVFM